MPLLFLLLFAAPVWAQVDPAYISALGQWGPEWLLVIGIVGLSELRQHRQSLSMNAYILQERKETAEWIKSVADEMKLMNKLLDRRRD